VEFDTQGVVGALISLVGDPLGEIFVKEQSAAALANYASCSGSRALKVYPLVDC